MPVAEPGTAARERVLVIDLVRYLDRVAFIPRDLVRAYASGRIGVDVFDRYRATCEQVTGPVRDGVWSAVVDALCVRTTATVQR